MKIDLGKATASGTLIALLTTHTILSQATTLFAHGNDDQLYLVDTDTVSASVVGSNNVSSILTEIEQSPFGTILGSDTLVNTNLLSISPDTGAVIDVQTMTFPEGGNVITAMEFVGNTLYAGLATEGSQSGPGASSLVTIDRLTGNVTIVGDTGIGKPLGGLAWDGTTMYAVSAGGSGSLYTLDLGTGAATLIGDTAFTMTALELGDNGLLYGLPRSRSSSANHLLRIDTVTGAGIDLGLITRAPANGLVSLTSTPPQVPTIKVAIDIKPDNTINPVNPRSKGDIKVAILTTENFDASLVDASTLSFGPGGAAPVNYRLDDINLDGYWDLVVKFHTTETGIACGDVDATITGQMLDSTPIDGTDFINTVGC